MSRFTPASAVVAALAAALCASTALAQDCDCARRVGLCQAAAAYDGATISFTSQTEECSRISFSVAEHSAAITIRNGAGQAAFSVPGAQAGERVSVDACYVCDVRGARR